MAGYGRLILGIAAIGVFIILVIGLGIFYANQGPKYTQSTSSSSITSESSPFTSITTFKSYDNQIVYMPPTQKESNTVGGCGIYARAQYDPPYYGYENGTLTNYSIPSSNGVLTVDVPLGTTVALTYFGIFNGTGSCPVPSFFVVKISSGLAHPNGTLSIGLTVAPTSNRSVYGASLTFTSVIAGYPLNFTLAQLPSEYRSTVSAISANFNMGQIYSQFSTSTAYANATKFAIG